VNNMIEDDNQYQVTCKQITKFERAIKYVQEHHDLTTPIGKAQLDALVSVRNELQAEVDEYWKEFNKRE